MKNKHRIKQCLSLLLAGGIALTNLGVALPAFAEDAPATPETASAATPETAEANVPTPNLVQITENLYDDLPDAPRQLLTKRKQLPKTDDVQSQHESVNTALKQLRQEERLCRKIAEHSLEVQQHLTEARRDRAEQQKLEQERARDRRPNIDLTL